MKKEEKITLKSQFNTMAKIMKKTYKKKTSSKPKVVYVQKRTVEQKELNTFVSGAIATNGSFVYLNSIGFGSDTGQRVGRQIQGNRLDYKFMILGASASGLIDFLRVTFVLDMQANAGTFLNTDVYEGGAGGSQTTWHKNTKAWPKRFVFLKDMLIPVQNQSTGGSCNGDKDSQAQSGSISLAKYPLVQFPFSSSGIPTTGALVMILTTYQNTGLATTSCGLYGTFKYVYSDD